jgi:enhancing lycopene biosynthesis protein 2
MHEVNHTTGEATDTSRNVLLESARIARGKVAHLQVKI